jgi:hypothetical protein
MATLQTSVPNVKLSVNTKRKNKERGHHIRVWIAALTSIVFLGLLTIYGADYYLLPLSERPFSDKYQLLKPGGVIGLKLGILGTLLFCVIFLYAFRKIIPWLGRIGTAKHWMDFHVIAGVSAPIVIAFHASFKFRGIAGIGFWIMLAVAISGFVGRYLYSQIPRSLSAAELSLTELQSNESELAESLANQSIYSTAQLNRILVTPSAENIRKLGPLVAIGQMIALNLRLPFQMAGLRRTASSFGQNMRSMGGLFSSGNEDVEQVVHLVRQKVSLSRRIAFLNHTQKLFHLWHVIHRPFSYAFAVLAVLHICVVMGFGFMGLGLR